MTTRSEILAIYERLSPCELAHLIAIGGTLPHGTRNRYWRMREARRLMRDAANERKGLDAQVFSEATESDSYTPFQKYLRQKLIRILAVEDGTMTKKKYLKMYSRHACRPEFQTPAENEAARLVSAKIIPYSPCKAMPA